MDSLSGVPFPLTIKRSMDISRFAGVPLELCALWGPTCDVADLVRKSVYLPTDLEVGDWIGFRGAGAYGTATATEFNGFSRSTVDYTTGVGPDADAVRAALKPFSSE